MPRLVIICYIKKSCCVIYFKNPPSKTILLDLYVHLKLSNSSSLLFNKKNALFCQILLRSQPNQYTFSCVVYMNKMLAKQPEL